MIDPALTNRNLKWKVLQLLRTDWLREGGLRVAADVNIRGLW